MPYPFGSQAVSIQDVDYMSQNVNLQSGITYTLTFSACGRPGYSGANQIDIMLDIIQDQIPSVILYSFTPPLVWTKYSTTFTVSSSVNYQLSFMGKINSINNSTAIQNIQLGTGVNSLPGTYTYSMCEQAAITGGYQYFALQDVNTNNSQGYCAVSNDAIAPTQNGISYVASGQIALWSSNTAGNPGAYASFVNGSLKVLNSSGAAIFSTPYDNTGPSNYIGCYTDVGGAARAMTNTISSSGQLLPATGPYSWSFGVQQCQQAAQQNNASYFGLQDVNSEGQAVCFISNDLGQTQQYGIASNCTQISDDSWTGGAGSNAVYNTSIPNSNYYLILQDDGNMCIYLGSGPYDNQGGVWCAMTNGQQQEGNPLMVAANNKFGQAWMPSGSALAPGEYLSYTNGNLVLIMQSDGNLVLYTYQLTENCQQMADGNTGGGVGANALYALNEVGVSTNMSQLAYIDQNSELHPYPSTNTTYTNTYATMSGVDSSGYDIPNAAYGNATVAQCQTSCNSNSDCAGFAFSSNTCYPKTSSMYPAGEMEINPNVDLYIRNQIPQTPPVGVSTNTNNIDTVLYQNYVNGGAIGQSYGLANATSAQQQQLQQLQTNLNLLSNQINGLTNQFETGNQQLEQQSQANSQGLTNYINDIEKTNKKIKAFNTNVDNVLQDSDIIVLKQNYDYLFWSILAVTTVIISMNIIKK